MTGRQSRAERAATPLARDSIRKIAESVGGCLHPVQLRRTDTVTGETMPVMVPCGATLASICPPCAERAKALRATQCREGWHLEGEPDLTWDAALDAIGPHDQARHVARFGPKFDAQGVLAGSKDAEKCIGYLTKYLTKQIADCQTPETDAQRAHAGRLTEALRYEPCSPTCANWLLYGIQPKNPRPGLVPGTCKGKAHRPEHFGYAGRRVLVSRKWSGKTLADHRADRKAWLVETLGLKVPDPTRYTWSLVTPGDPDYLPPDQRLLHIIADRARWKAALTEARRRSRPPTAQPSATAEAA